MRYVMLTVISFFCLILQDTLFNDFSVAGGKPDFLLIIVVFFAIFNGSRKGGFLGIILGLLEDLMLGRFIGVNALCKGLIGACIGSFERQFYKNNFSVPIFGLLIGTFVNAALYYIISRAIGSNIMFSGMMLTAIPNAIYNSCFAPLIYVLFYRWHNRDVSD